MGLKYKMYSSEFGIYTLFNKYKILFIGLILSLFLFVGMNLKSVFAATTHTVCASGCDYTDLQDAVDNSVNGDTVKLDEDLSIGSQVTINKTITIDGDGRTLSPTFSETSNDNNAAIGIIGTSNVTISDLAIEGVGGTSLHGINVYESTAVELNNVSVLNNDHSGIVANSSSVAVTNISTAGSGWHGINVDQKTSQASSLTVNGVSTHSESAHIPDIYVDDTTKDVAVNDTNNQYNFADFGNARAYKLIPLPGPVENVDTGETFSTIQAAIDDSDTDNGDTIKADAGTYPEQVHITKGVTINGANAGINPNTGTRSTESIIDNSAGSGIENGFYIDGDVSNATIDGFKFYGVKGATGAESGAVLIRGSSTTATNITIENNIFDHTGRGVNKDSNASFNDLHIQNNKFVEIGTGITTGSGEYSAIKIQAATCTESGCSDLEITDNVVDTTSYSGFLWANVDGVNVSGNTISNSDTYSIGAGPNTSAGGDTTIENNIIDYSGSSSAGAIRIKDGTHTGSVLVLGNTINNSDIGVSVDSGTNVTGDFKVNKNKLENLGSIGVKNGDSSFLLDALNNWWGDASGPTDSVNTDNSSPLTNPSGTGAEAKGTIEYADWCSDASCTVDATAPDVSNIKINNEVLGNEYQRNDNCDPLNQLYLVGGEVDLSATITDAASDVSSAKYKIRKVSAGGCTQSSVFSSGYINMHDDNSDDEWLTPAGSVFNTSILPSDGAYTIMLATKDTAGNEKTQYIDIDVDNTPPAKPQMLGFYKGHGTPSEDIIPCGGFTNNPQIRITWEENSESDIDYYWLGTKFNPKHEKVFNKTFYNGNMTPGNNPYHYTVIAVDKAGNESEISDQCGLILDQVAPVVTVTPLPGDGILKGTVTFDITVTDDNPDPSILDRIWTYLYNNAPPQKLKGANVDLSSGHGTFTVNTKLLDDGAATLDVGKLYDAAGNPSGTGDNYFSGYTIDNTRPELAFTSPASFSAPFATGPNVTVEASDPGSGLNILVIHVYDDSDALLSICGTANGSELAAGEMSCDLSSLPNGTYYIKAGTNDNAGNNKTINSGNFIIDKTKPNVSITTPSNGDVLDTGTFTVEGTASDDNTSVTEVKYTVTEIDSIGGSYVASVDSGTTNGTSNWDFDVSGLTDGFYRLKVQAFDEAGNWKYKHHDVQVELAPVISEEASADPITTESITITWTTDKPATSRVVYDTVSHPGTPDSSSAPNYGYAESTIEDSTKVTLHSVTVTGLTPGTTYYFRTVSHGSPEAVSGEISASTDEESTSSPQSTGGDGSFTATGFSTTPFTTFGTFGTTTPAPGGGNVLNATDDDNDGNGDENNGEVQADTAGVSSATTAEEASKSSWSWWWILPIIAALLLLFAILRRRGDEEEA